MFSLNTSNMSNQVKRLSSLLFLNQCFVYFRKCKKSGSVVFFFSTTTRLAHVNMYLDMEKNNLCNIQSFVFLSSNMQKAQSWEGNVKILQATLASRQSI